MIKTRFKFGLRLKLLLLSCFLLTIPWLGYEYVWEMEKYLRIGQEKSLTGTVRAVATALHERPLLFEKQASFLPSVDKGRDLYAYPIVDPIQLDGQLDDWRDKQRALHYADGYVIAGEEHYHANDLSFNHMVGKYRDYLYSFFEVIDDSVVYRPSNSLKIDQNDALQIAFVTPAGDFRRYLIATKQAGWLTPYELKSELEGNEPLAPEPRIQGMWHPTERGYNIELRIPLELLGSQLSFAIVDIDADAIQAAPTIVGTAHYKQAEQLGTILVPSPEIEQIVKGLGHSESRIWVVDKHRRVLATAGDLKQSDGVWSKMVTQPQAKPWYSPLTDWLSGWYYQILTKPTTNFSDDIYDIAQLEGEHIDKALLGRSATSWRLSTDKRAVILSAAYPIYSGGQVMGVVIAEETTNGIRTLRNHALEKLFNVILAVMTLGTLALFLFASRISSRIRSLRNQTEQAIDEQGRIVQAIDVTTASDEIGDLQRSFADMVARLGQYTDYLQGMSARLSHELRTPVAVVRSSLESLEMDQPDLTNNTYMIRAKEGISRLSAILTLMSEATRLEQSLQNSDKGIFPIAKVVSGCVQGYQLTQPNQALNLILDCPDDVQVLGGAELFSQLFDKLISNAIEFAEHGSTIDIQLVKHDEHVQLSIENTGPVLPVEMQARLFDSMVSVRKSSQQEQPHLGLGLYIARLICEFHQGHISIENNTGESGVISRVKTPIHQGGTAND